MAPESDSAEGGGLPSNTTYGITGPDGQGEADFAVWTSAENASLGCSATVSCSLVAVPIVGLSCDAYGKRLPAGSVQTTKTGVPLSESQLAAADATCRRTGAYVAGESQSSTLTDQAVRGNLWWSESNWRNRITRPARVRADRLGLRRPERRRHRRSSWARSSPTSSPRPGDPSSARPRTCSASPTSSRATPLARTLVNVGEIDAALTTAPRDGGYSKPVVQAPIAFGGFAIAFSVDDANKQRRETLNLNARLVAKLLTSSYPAYPVVRDNHPSIGDNPLNITLDPEFQALNPGLPGQLELEAGAALQVFSSSSDLVWALTSWIDADPEARAWLDGYADPWGMKVNEAYRDIVLPVDNWPLLDDFVAPQWYQDQNACYGNSPTPFMQLIANPPSNLSTVLLNMQYASSTVQTVCKYDGYDPTTLPLRQQGRQTVGYRFVLGLVSLSAAERYNLRTAALQTTSTVSPGQQFTNADGRTFVAPDTAGLLAGSGAAHRGPRQRAVDPRTTPRSSTAEGGAAYPGAMPVYAVVPTEGLEEDDGHEARQAAVLREPATASSPGTANGQLPAGYLPMTEANGLVPQHDYLAVGGRPRSRAQAGDVPTLDAAPPERDEACDFSKAQPTTPTPSPSETADRRTCRTVACPDVAGARRCPTARRRRSPSRRPRRPAAAAAGRRGVDRCSRPGRPRTFGRLGRAGLLLFAFATALAGSLMRWYDPIGRGVVAAGPRRGPWRASAPRGGGGAA